MYDLDVTYFRDTDDGVEYLEFVNITWFDTEEAACMAAEALSHGPYDYEIRKRNADGVSFDVRPSGPNAYTHSWEVRPGCETIEWHKEERNG